jgi:hypothetical protein
MRASRTPGASARRRLETLGGVDLDGDVLVVIAEVDRTEVAVITVTG